MLTRTLCRASLASLLLGLFACASSPDNGGAKTGEAERAGTLYTFTSDAAGFDTHSFYYDTGSEVVVFDAQFTEQHARALIADVRAHTASEITYVVVTHPNPDKFQGVGPFRELGAKVVASRATSDAVPGVYEYKKGYFTTVAKSFTAETYPPPPVIDVTFSGSYRLPLASGARVELRELAHGGVTTTQTVAHVPAVKALVVGDLVHHKAHAWLEGGIRAGKPDPDLGAWRAALDEIASGFAGTTVYGGRGEAASVEQAVADEKAYLDRAESIVREYVTSLGPRKAELSGDRAGEHFKELERRIAEAFPQYALPYLIEYGVYGLAGEIAAGGLALASVVGGRISVSGMGRPPTPVVDVDAVEAPAFGLADELEPFVSRWHAHRKHQLLYSASGALHLEVEGAQWLLPPQRAAWIPAAMRHRVRATSPVALRTVYLAPGGAAPEAGSPKVFSVSPLAREMILYAMRWGPSEGSLDPVARAFFGALGALLSEWFVEARPYYLPSARSPELGRAMRLMLDRIDEPLSAGEVARAAGLSTRTLARRFAAEAQTTWRRFLHDARMLKAMDLLTRPGARVTETAFAVGFESLGAFSRAFERFAGEPPRDYRRRVGAPEGRGPDGRGRTGTHTQTKPRAAVGSLRLYIPPAKN
jgi:AraC-like DNA-binding protein/glyoxylase-like metal-dependent hydrolase (beta-lactamase superfamily II)/mannose-6-phosphate isomerase-like protein (cupin superfamily)